MGVPKYYRWLSERYPLINQAIYDAIRPEFDCMYLDMNGIIHVATHGPGVDATKPLDDDTAMSCVFQYIDKVVRLGRPNRLLYMCLDGVAPRAKMNQQRQRRFRSAQESAKTREVAIAKGDLDPDAQLFDSNCITPGTTFMAKLTEHLKFFIRKKIEEDPLWRQFTVLFSGHEVPGEAEHKIMRYIRMMKSSKDYDPNTRHLLYGLDADLIFLSLATHEPHFALLREEIIFGKPSGNDARKSVSNSDEFQLLHISILRDYLEHEFRTIDIPFGFDLERIIDDWIFISFFIGNDFVPHLPSMDIHHGTLDRLITIYKSLLPRFDSYLTDSGIIDLEKLEVMLHRISEFELEILELQKRDMEYIESKRGHRSGPSRVERLPVGRPDTETEKPAVVADEIESESDADDLNLAVRDLEIEEEDLTVTYYNEKWFGLMDDPHQLDMLCRSYIEGLCWVLLYYYQGVPSWGWYYPYFYAPLASSLRNLYRYQIEFTLGDPFLPFEQLLGVLPPASAGLIPIPVGNLMTDPSSPIIDFYPTTFAVDMNGKKNDWEGIALIPFVEETRLIASIRSLPKSSFSKEERHRNRHGEEFTYRYDSKVTDPAQSSIPQVFASIDVSHCRVEKFLLPAECGAPFRTHLCKGLKMPAPSFPSLNLLNITMALAHANVAVFGRGSKRESLVASVLSDPSEPLLDRARALIGKQCTVDWPFLRDAMVISVTGNNLRYSAEAPDGTPLNVREARAFSDDAINDRMNILTSRAVDIGDEKVRVEVRRFTGMGRSNTGATHKKFSVETVSYPAQLVIASRSVADSRFDTAPAQSMKEAFPIRCPIVYMGTPAEFYGCAGVVLGHDSRFSATVRLNTFTSEDDIKALIRNLQSKEKWIPSFKAAQELNLSPSVLGRISGAILVNPGRANLGLNLKLVQRQMMVPGYTRIKTGTTGLWEYSAAAMRLVDAYCVEFPELLSAIEDTEQRVIDLREYIDDPKEYINRVKSWLKAQPCSQLPLVPQSSSVLSPDAIAEIERLQSELRQKQQKCQDVTLTNVAVQLLYKQAQRVQWSPTEAQFANLGDRVLFLGGHHGVPFGMRGNLVGVHENEVEVVFDESILSGSDLNGRCSPARGLTLSQKCLLNLSRPRVPPLHPKAPRPDATAFIPRTSQAQVPSATKVLRPDPSSAAADFTQAERPAAPKPHPASERPRYTERQPQPSATPKIYSRESSENGDNHREWASMWKEMQQPETAAKLEDTRTRATPRAPKPFPRHWAPSDQQTAPEREPPRYIRHQPPHAAVARAPVINPEHPEHRPQSTRLKQQQQQQQQPQQEQNQRQQQQQQRRPPRQQHQQQPREQGQRDRNQGRERGNEPPTAANGRPSFSTHSSMKTLFGLRESPSETARRSLVPTISPTQETRFFGGSSAPTAAAARPSVPTAQPASRSQRPPASVKVFTRSSSQAAPAAPAARWRKKQSAPVTQPAPDLQFRPFSSYGLMGQNQPQPTLVRPEDLQHASS